MDESSLMQLDILSFDRISFAHSMSMPDYHYDLKSHGYGIYGDTPEGGGILEIGFVEQGPLLLEGASGSFTVGEQGIFIIPPDSEFTVRTVEPGAHRHTSAEFLIASRPLSASAGAQHAFRAPFVLSAARENSDIIACIRAIVAATAARLYQNYFEECAAFMQLLSLIAERVSQMQAHRPVLPGQQFLCKRAKDYISSHLSEPMRVAEIADAVGVSKNYLTTVFSKSEGETLVSYANRLKLAHIVDLIHKYGCSLSEAGAQVGLLDVNYTSRLFRRYYGMTFTEFLRRNSLGSAGSKSILARAIPSRSVTPPERKTDKKEKTDPI